MMNYATLTDEQLIAIQELEEQLNCFLIALDEEE